MKNARKGLYHQKTMGSSLLKKGLLPILLLIRQKTNLVEVRRVNTASTISQRDAYKAHAEKTIPM